MSILENRYLKVLILLIAAILLNIAAITFADFDVQGELKLNYNVQASRADTYQVFFSNGEEWNENNSIKIEYVNEGEIQTLKYKLPNEIQRIRLDLGNNATDILLSNISLSYLWESIDIGSKILSSSVEQHEIAQIKQDGNSLIITTNGNDPYIVLNLDEVNVSEMLKISNKLNYIFKILVCMGLNILLIIFIKKRKFIMQLVGELLFSKELIWSLSKNDFRTKYAGSYLGITWAFVQPIVSILVYWFVFQVGFKSAPVENFPFVLWLVAGLVPWFFFSESVMNATNSLIEYSYLVKKVVFKISVLPIIKIISAVFVHIFFIGFSLLLFAAYGYYPDLYTLQVFYYTVCMIIFVLGISYTTSAIVLFFRDLGQIINIFMQVGMWMTPIMWSYEMIPNQFQWILKLNPMYYIVEGYRDSLINKVWFWERFNMTIYFWIVCIGVFSVGTLIFKKLKVHFADVL